MAWARCAPLGDVRELGEASALDGSAGCDLWIVPSFLQADVSQMVGEDVHDGFRSLAHAGELETGPRGEAGTQIHLIHI